MRRALLFVMLVMMLTLVSCQKNNPSKHPIVGTWGRIRIELSQISVGGLFEATTEYDPYNPSKDGDMKLVITYESNNLFLMTYYRWNINTSTWGAVLESRILVEDRVIYYENHVKKGLMISDDQLVLYADNEAETGIHGEDYYTKME